MRTTIEDQVERRTVGASREARGTLVKSGAPGIADFITRSHEGAKLVMGVPAKVLAYFRHRGSRRRKIWAVQIHALSTGWKEIDWASPRLVARYGHRESSGAWPVDATVIQFTDGEIFADFGRNELCSGGGL